MADRVYQPGIGPTDNKSLEDALDAEVPNPDEICDPTELYATYLTTQPYPIYRLDEIEDVHDITFVGLAGWDNEHMTSGYEFVDGSLTHKISYSAYSGWIDNMTSGYEWEDASLTQIIGYVEYDFGPDHMQSTYSWVDATLTTVIGYIFIDQPPDWVDEDHTITGITLTT